MDESTRNGSRREINKWKSSRDTETISWDNTNRELVRFGAAIKSEELETASVAEDAVDQYANIESRVVLVASLGLTTC